MKINRRQFLQYAGTGTAMLTLPSAIQLARKYDLPVRAITRGPKFHWFGYYDKMQFNQSNTLLLGMEVDFEMRSPIQDDVINMGLIDLQNNDKWTEIG